MRRYFTPMKQKHKSSRQGSEDTSRQGCQDIYCTPRKRSYYYTSACSGRRCLRSASKGDFVVPRARTATIQKRAFSIVGPFVWNGLPSDLRSLQRDLYSSFYKLLKTLLFARAWAESASV